MESTSDNTIQYQLTPEEASSQIFRLLLLPKIVWGMAITFFFGIGLLILRSHQPIVGIFVTVFPVLFFYFYRQAANKILTQHPEFLESQTVTFDENGIAFTNSVSQHQWPWSRISELIEKRNFILLRFDGFGSGAILPKRVFAPGQMDRFLSLAKANSRKS